MWTVYILQKLHSNLGITVFHLLLFLHVWPASQPTIRMWHFAVKRLDIYGKTVALSHVSARYWYVSCTQLNLVVASKYNLVGKLNTVMCLSQDCLWIYNPNNHPHRPNYRLIKIHKFIYAPAFGGVSDSTVPERQCCWWLIRTDLAYWKYMECFLNRPAQRCNYVHFRTYTTQPTTAHKVVAESSVEINAI
jgi:hypothetical protein